MKDELNRKIITDEIKLRRMYKEDDKIKEDYKKLNLYEEVFLIY